MFIIILENGGKYYIESENKKIFSLDLFYHIRYEIYNLSFDMTSSSCNS